jgi:hypothetical protein
MSGDWFHQHFGVSKGGLRLAAWHAPNNHPALKAGRPGERMNDVWAIDVNKGGSAIPYHQEDPAIRRLFEETLAREGAISRMEPRLYERPAEVANRDGGPIAPEEVEMVVSAGRDALRTNPTFRAFLSNPGAIKNRIAASRNYKSA